MACTAVAITFTKCSHRAFYIIRCSCGRGMDNCDLTECRIILKTSFPNRCPKDVDDQCAIDVGKAHAYYLQRMSRLELEAVEWARARAHDPSMPSIASPFQHYMETLSTAHRRRLRADEKRFDKLMTLLDTASDWTRDVGADLHHAMFEQEKSRRHSARIDVFKRWLRKPPLLRVIEHGLLSKETLQEVQNGFGSTQRKRRRKRLLVSLSSPKVPPVPLFPTEKSLEDVGSETEGLDSLKTLQGTAGGDDE